MSARGGRTTPVTARASRPAGLLAAIDARFGPHPACGNDYQVVWHRADWVDRLGSALVAGASARPAIVRYLQDQVPDWELCVVAITELHSASEMFWYGVDPVHPLAGADTAALARRWLDRVYDAVDEAVGELVESAGPGDHVVAFSPHGMGSNTTDVPGMVLMPELLHRLEIGSPLLRNPAGPPPGPGDPPPTIPADGTWAAVIDSQMPGRLGRTARRAVRRVAPVAGARLHRRLTRRPTADLDRPTVSPGLFGVPVRAESTADERRGPLLWHQARRYQRFWPEMHAFVLPSFYDTAIRINLAGREARGIVPPAEYAAWCDRMEALVRALRNPYTGNLIAESVIRPMAADPFARTDTDADLVVRWAEATAAIEHPALGVVGPVPIRRPGGHGYPTGFVAIAGPDVEPGDLGTRHPPDVAATILALLGRPVGPGMEGTPILDAQGSSVR